MPDVNVPLLGPTPKGALFAGGLAAAGVTVYMVYRHNKNKQATASATPAGYGYGQYAYGYGSSGQSGYYGYGSGYAYGGFTPYQLASEYGYGAFGYGYYNPYTGQWLGPGNTQPPITGGSGSGSGGSGGGTGGTGGGGQTHTITANGKDDLWRTAKNNSITEGHLVRLNPNLAHLVGSKRPIPRGTKVKV
jgi:hypothetical protein